jgi:tetratricopeptide repeat protein 8
MIQQVIDRYYHDCSHTNTIKAKMDPFYLALSLFRRRQFDKCADVCGEILEKQPLDQAAWCLKMRALTQRVYVDDIESEELIEGDFLDDNAVATAPRPGTSIKTAVPTTAIR